MNVRTEVVPVRLSTGAAVPMQATVIGGEDDVAAGILSFERVTDVIRGISADIFNTLDAVQTRKATVEFGLEFAVESGKLTALLVKGAGTASLKITLEWDGARQTS